MPRKPASTLTPLETEIMKILWREGAAAVESVRSKLAGEPAYTTVQTMLNLLVKKGRATRKLEGRAYVYASAQSRRDAVKQTLQDVMDRLFGGSAEELVLGLLDTRQLTPEKLARLQKMVEGQKGEKK